MQMNNKKPIGGIGGGIVAAAANQKLKTGIGRGVGIVGTSSGDLQPSAIPQMHRANTHYTGAGMNIIQQNNNSTTQIQQQYNQSNDDQNLLSNNRAIKSSDLKNVKKEAQIDNMTQEAVLNELKDKRLPTYGTAAERKDRLKKQYGIIPKSKSNIGTQNTGNVSSILEMTNSAQFPMNNPIKRVTTTDKIDQIKINRDARRMKMEEARKLKSEREANNELQGIKVDVDFQNMVEQEKVKLPVHKQHVFADQMKISVCFKKRPIFRNELAEGEIDVVSVRNPKIIVHDCKYRVDGVTKEIQNTEFKFDNAFSEFESNEELYFYQVRPILDLIFNQGIVTIFAYGQTGSGKTFTMNGIQSIAVKDLFERGIDYWENHSRNFTVTVSMYEIYGGKLYDLLNDHQELKLREDKNNTIQIAGLKEQFVDTDEQILQLITQGNQMRTTHATKANDTSSRSHAITQIKIQEQGQSQCGKLLLVDLAGSERAQDCQSNNKDRQAEGAEINQSLLGLKECVRALDQQRGQASQGQHVPFRQSKLTMVLRDSFLANEHVKIVMLTCICPGMSSANHTLNSLRYAERLKEKAQGNQGASKGLKGLNQEQINEELRIFLEKHGKQMNSMQEEEEIAMQTHQQKQYQNQRLNNMFYQQDEQINEMMDDDDQDMMLNEEEDDILMQQQDMEDEMAFIQQNKQAQFLQPKVEQPLKSPNMAQNFTKKNSNLQNITNQMHGSVRDGQNNSSQNVRQQQQQDYQQIQNHQKSNQHQNQFVNKNQNLQNQTTKVSPVQAKFNEGAKSIPKNQSSNQYNVAQNQVRKSRQDEHRQNEQQKQIQNVTQKKMYGKQQNDQMMQPSMMDEYDGNEEDALDQQDFEEERLRAEENIYNTHLDAVKEEVQLIQREGEMITTLEKAIKNEEDYDMRDYLENARSIAMQKIQMYQQLMNNIEEFQNNFMSK